MAIKQVQVRHKVTGAKTFLPETALPHFPDFVKTPSQKARDQVPDGTAFPAASAEEEQEPTVTATTSSASATNPPNGK